MRLIEKHTECDEIYFMGRTNVAVAGKQLLLGRGRFEAILQRSGESTAAVTTVLRASKMHSFITNWPLPSAWSRRCTASAATRCRRC